jgi:hypothetical protein
MDKSVYLCSDYATDIMSFMKEKEEQIYEFKKQSPQWSRRRHLIDWTSIVAEKLCLTNCTLHLAVKLIDYFMDGHDIQDPQLYLVCLGSLLLAAKMEEKDSNVPKCSELNTFVKNHFPLSDFLSLEFVILTYFNWNLLIPTACHFTEMILPHSIHPTDSHNGGPIVSFREAKAYFHQYVKYFLDIAIQESAFVDIIPSKLAAALIAASRMAFGLTPTWPPGMHETTGYQKEELTPFTDLLLTAFRRDSPNNDDSKAVPPSPDEGYHSRTASPTARYLQDLNSSEVMDEEEGTPPLDD